MDKLPQDEINKILDRRTPYFERLAKPDVSSDLREMMSEFITKSQDKVTGLQARWALDETLDELRKREIPHAVAAIDFRNLGGLNTAFEHEKTNEILREVAKDYIQKNTREWGGEVYRSGGDEFHAVIPYITHKELNKKMEDLQAQIQKGVVEVRNLADLPHVSQNGMPTGAGNIDYGCADSSITDRSEMLAVADDRLTNNKSDYLEDVRARELKHNRL